MRAEIERNLRAAGWTPDRRVQVDRWTAYLRRYDLPMIPASRDILQNLGGLLVQPVPTPNALFTPYPVLFDPCYDWGPYSVIRKLAKHFDCQMTPLAVCEWEFDGSLIVADDGRFFETHFRSFWYIGKSFDEAMERLLFGTSAGEETDLSELGIA